MKKEMPLRKKIIASVIGAVIIIALILNAALAIIQQQEFTFAELFLIILIYLTLAVGLYFSFREIWQPKNRIDANLERKLTKTMRIISWLLSLAAIGVAVYGLVRSMAG